MEKIVIRAHSFYPAKLLGGFGDNGALVTNSKEIYEYIKDARNHFKDSNEDWGMNSRMDNLQAAILNVKIKYLPEVLKRREEIAKMYLVGLEGVGLPNNTPTRVWQDFIIRVNSKKVNEWDKIDHKFVEKDWNMRDRLYEHLKRQGIETLKNEYPFPPEYPKPPLTAKYEAETLRLPINEVLEDEEIEEVIDTINDFFK